MHQLWMNFISLCSKTFCWAAANQTNSSLVSDLHWVFPHTSAPDWFQTYKNQKLLLTFWCAALINWTKWHNSDNSSNQLTCWAQSEGPYASHCFSTVNGFAQLNKLRGGEFQLKIIVYNWSVTIIWQVLNWIMGDTRCKLTIDTNCVRQIRTIWAAKCSKEADSTQTAHSLC